MLTLSRWKHHPQLNPSASFSRDLLRQSAPLERHAAVVDHMPKTFLGCLDQHLNLEAERHAAHTGVPAAPIAAAFHSSPPHSFTQ